MTVSTIVIGVDGSEGSALAVEWAVDLAQQTAAGVIAVHTFEPLASLEGQEPPYDFAALELKARARLESVWIEPFSRAGVAVEPRLTHGAPYACLLDAAARGLGFLRGLALGSTSDKLLHTSTRPVVVIPPRR